MSEDYAYNHDFDLAAFLSAPDGPADPPAPLAPRNSSSRRESANPEGRDRAPIRSRWLDDVAAGRPAASSNASARELPRLEQPIFDPPLFEPEPAAARRESREQPREQPPREQPRHHGSPTPAEDRMRVLREQLAREHAAAPPREERRPERREPAPARHEEPRMDSRHERDDRHREREAHAHAPRHRAEGEPFTSPATSPAPARRSVSAVRTPIHPPAIRDSTSEDLDALERRGREAMAAGQLQVAMVCFQRALRAAPLREDLRALLMSTLDDRAMQSPSAPDFLPDRDPRRVERDIDEALRREAEERRHAALSGKPAPRANESRWLPAPAVKALVLFRDGLFRWIWRAAMVVVVAAIGFAAWPIGSEFVRDLLIPASEREARELLVQSAAALKDEKPERAREMLERAIDLAPLEVATEKLVAKNLAATYHALGNELYRADKPEEAAELFEKAVKLDGKSAELQGDLGMAAMFAANQSFSPSRGNSSLDKYWLARALEAFEAALDVEPDNAKWLWRAAECHVKMGNGPLARPLWQRVLEVETDPSSSYAKEARKALLSSGSGGRG